jgi:hypothetical protein
MKAEPTTKVLLEMLYERIPELFDRPKREWVGLMRGVRVAGDMVIISAKGGNDAARELCGALIKEMEETTTSG